MCSTIGPSEAHATTSHTQFFNHIDSDDDAFSEIESDIKQHHAYYYYYKLASESSFSSEDTESALSIQAYETDIARDTPDTDTKSEWSDDYNYVEYEIVSEEENSTNDVKLIDVQSSGSEDNLLAVGAIAAAIYQSTSQASLPEELEGESVADSSDFETGSVKFNACVNCKKVNQYPAYRFCRNCFQKRKSIFPPRPKSRKKKRAYLPASCSQDSGIASLENNVPKKESRKRKLSSADDTVNKSGAFDGGSTKLVKSNDGNVMKAGTSFNLRLVRAEPLKMDASSKVMLEEEDREKAAVNENVDRKFVAVQTEELFVPSRTPELCIMCNETETNCLFLHGGSGHSCCCYKCAMTTWKTVKYCPVCRRKVSKIVKILK